MFKKLKTCLCGGYVTYEFQPSGMFFFKKAYKMVKGLPDGHMTWLCDHMVCLCILHNSYNILYHAVSYQRWHNGLHATPLLSTDNDWYIMTVGIYNLCMFTV